MVFQTNEIHKLQVIRGTTKVIRVTIRDAAGNLYTPQEGDVVRFGVKRSSDSTRYLIEQATAQITESFLELSRQHLLFRRVNVAGGVMHCIVPR